ncbi:hypothetical protein [Paracoccus sp. MKU1]|uniref:hypothetical protein n=1 Tax=Paracoccus sp. MKU1 TaxID=1745182 RepID=UPI000719328F|nr:hypothetical protein [Paracoccus sp. MKU1]KRW94277.1 hypothetical protein AQY21_20315 [Paracoccus sp. MKU1]
MTQNSLVGRRATFKDYAQLEEGFEPILKSGQLLEITKVDDNGNFVVVAIAEDGTRLNMEGNAMADGDTPMADQVWEQEIEVLPETEDAGDDITDDPTAVVEGMKGAELDDWASRNGVETPDGWNKMKVADKRAFLKDWISSASAEVPQADAAPEEAATAPEQGAAEPVAETPAQEPAAQTGSAEPTATLMRTMTDSESVRNILAEQDAVDAAIQLNESIERTYYMLGGVLAHIDETGIYKRHGYEGKKGFEEFCQQTVGIAYRKARYLIDIYVTFRKIGFDESRLAQIGWSKAKELARIDAARLEADIDGLLEYAASNTREQLINHIKENYEVATRAETVKTTTFSFRVVETEAETVNLALEHAKTLIGEDDVNRAFLHMCGDWMNAGNSTDLDLDTFIALGIGRFGKDAVLAALNTDEASAESAEAQSA